MFFQPPEIEATISNNTVKSASAQKSARRKRRKRTEKFNSKKQILKKEKQRFAHTMSSWAENFTMAATWQLKHQVAHWKSKARALEYENNILRTMLRQYYVKGKPESVASTHDPMSVSAQSESDSEQNASDGEEVEEETDEEKIEISEEFINFLKGNAEFRRMRQERERLRKIEQEMPARLLEQCPDAQTDKKLEYQKLYGAHWQRIAALEMSLQSQFISDCDKEKPTLWPVIPLRL